GELDDLVEGLRHDPAPHGVHFSGHGGPGTLVFEDRLGASHEVPVTEMLDEIRRRAPERFPRFFYLASCHGNTPPTSVVRSEAQVMGVGVSASASQLHREGVTQVVGY